jgi:hypothetical protein
MNEQKLTQQFDAVLLQCCPDLTSLERQACVGKPKAVQDFLHGLLDVVAKLGTSFRLIARTESDSRWECSNPVEAIVGTQFSFTSRELLKPREEPITGGEVVRRAKEAGGLTGLLHASSILRESQKIPIEFRGSKFVFPEVWQSRNIQEELLWCIQWNGVFWELFHRLLYKTFDSSYRIADARPVVG